VTVCRHVGKGRKIGTPEREKSKGTGEKGPEEHWGRTHRGRRSNQKGKSIIAFWGEGSFWVFLSGGGERNLGGRTINRRGKFPFWKGESAGKMRERGAGLKGVRKFRKPLFKRVGGQLSGVRGEPKKYGGLR